jgi:hypothetical protein
VILRPRGAGLVGLVAALTCAVVTFSVSALAGAVSTKRRSLGARALRVASIPPLLRSQIAETIGRDAAVYGITDASYARARVITSTSRGILYALFGEHGACLYLDQAAACGDAGAPDQPLLAMVRSDADGYAIGGGIAARSVDAVQLVVPSRSPIRIGVADGAFAIPVGAGARAGPGTFLDVAEPTKETAP